VDLVITDVACFEEPVLAYLLLHVERKVFRIGNLDRGIVCDAAAELGIDAVCRTIGLHDRIQRSAQGTRRNWEWI